MKVSEKVNLYILSLAILFLIVFVMSVKVPEYDLSVCDKGCDFDGWSSALGSAIWLTIRTNWLPLLMCCCMTYCYFIKKDFNYMLKGGGQRTIRIRKVQNQDYEHLTFLTTYIIPFFGFSFDDLNRLAAYLILLILIGYIFIKTGKYYANPTLAVMGFKLYKGTFSDQNGIYENITVISTDSLKAEQVVYYKLISENVFYVRKK